jgi:uncharacterized protein YukE
MSKAIGDPYELERFAHSLHQFIEKLNDAMNDLNYSFDSLGDTWQDEKRASFEEDYNSLVQQLIIFEDNSSEKISYLLKLAAHLKDYLQS